MGNKTMRVFIEYVSTATIENGLVMGFLCADGSLTGSGEVLTEFMAISALKAFRNALNFNSISELRIKKLFRDDAEGGN